jgi:two-component system, OmpR family, alkaline phosphatase synthesis response regulator PhoP
MILIVEDDKSIRELLEYSLNNSGFEARGFACPSEFWPVVKQSVPELILLDIMLPEEDGLHILRTLRQNHSTADIPVILLTAKGEEYDKIIGLDSGADDYVTKPFSIMELISRIKAVLRRTEKEGAEEYQVGDIYLNYSSHIVKSAGKEVVLTYKEFELLYMLLRNKNIVLERDKLLRDIWGYDFDGETRTIDVHIRTLRSKLGDAGNYIKTVRGVGYKLEG